MSWFRQLLVQGWTLTISAWRRMITTRWLRPWGYRRVDAAISSSSSFRALAWEAGPGWRHEDERRGRQEPKGKQKLHMGTQVNAWTTHGQLAWTTCTASYQSWTVRLSCNCSLSSTTSISTAWTPLYVKLVMNRCHSVYGAVGFPKKTMWQRWNNMWQREGQVWVWQSSAGDGTGTPGSCQNTVVVFEE